MIIFRVDGNEKIGLGHVMRCMSIADAFLDAGEECFFLLADASAKEIVEKRGFRVFVMGTHFDCVEEELPEIWSVVVRLRPKCIVVDSYFVTERYLKLLGDLCRVVYLDDLAAFAYPVDGLVNYNIYGVDMDYAALYRNRGTKLPQCILGSWYAPLRREFRDIPACAVKEDVEDVLVSAGGADSIHLILGLARFLTGRPECVRGLRFHIVLGAMNTDKDEVRDLVSGMGNVVLHLAVQDMGALMCGCDLAVSAAGSTLYELCACGVPTVTYVLADNQMLGAKAFKRAGAMVSLGDIRGNMGEAANMVIEAVLGLKGNFYKRKRMAWRMRELVDGYGAERLVGELLKGCVHP